MVMSTPLLIMLMKISPGMPPRMRAKITRKTPIPLLLRPW